MEGFKQSNEIVKTAVVSDDSDRAVEDVDPRGGGERRYSVEAIYELLDAREAVYDGIDS